jgi:sigma-E factor negative regulatory protein RseC
MSEARNDRAAIVTRVEHGDAWLEVQDSAGCGSCSGQHACGSGLLGLHSRSREYRVRNTIGAQPGDSVRLSIASGGVLKGAFSAYLLPLGLSLAGAACGSIAGGSDAATATGLLLGLGAGWLLLRQEAAPAVSLQPQAVHLQRRFKEES